MNDPIDPKLPDAVPSDFRTGPDPDNPPWQSPPGEASAEDEEGAEAGPRPAEDPTDPGAAGPRPDPADATSEVTELAERMAMAQMHMRKPPKRTGIFIDAESLRPHVGDLLRTYLGGYQVDAWGNFTFTFESARVFVTVSDSPIGPQVGVFSITNVDLDLSDKLAGFLLGLNHQLGFGSFSYDGENRAIWLRHTLLGSTLDAPELQAAVAAVSSTAAHFDDQISEAFGGRAFHAVPEEEQQQAHPPEPTDSPPNASGYL